jgi:hypothetical protein
MIAAPHRTYTDQARAYVDRQLRRGSITQAHADQHVALAVMKDEFAARHGVREFKFSVRNVGRLFRSAGATADQANPVFRSPRGIGRWCDTLFCSGFLRAFDHHDLWGRDGQPVMLVGHPYGDPDDHRDIYDAIAGLGMTVETGGESYYGHGTYQVLVRQSD